MDIIETLKMFPKQCIVAEPQKISQDMTAPTSGYGGIFWGHPEESWPKLDGRYLRPVLTIRTNELPKLPDNLKDVALLNIFIDNEAHPDEKDATVIRRYSSLEGLTPLASKRGRLFGLLGKPQHPQLDFYKINWNEKTDYPDWLTLEHKLGEEKAATLCDEYYNQFENIETTAANITGIKLGGWPTMIQMSGIYFLMEEDPSYICQIDQTEVYMFYDSGIGYLCRGEIKGVEKFFMDGWTCA